MLKISLAAAAATLALASTPAMASNTHKTVSVRVMHGDLDLSRAEEVEVLKTRIASAATKACRVRSGLYSGWSSVDETCVRDATKAALAVAQTRIPSQVATAR